jgi:alkaline phosphatase D
VLRRGFLRALFSGFLVAWTGGLARTVLAAERYSFKHGVASGDPLQDGVILWTRISGGSGKSLRVAWKVASDPAMTTVLRKGYVRTNSARDYTVKADVRRLPPGTRLFYQFEVEGVLSPVGRTRTLASGVVSEARLAVVSCSNYAAGYFHAYREIANRDDIDAVIHLGDFIYEYGLGEYATEYAESLNRVPDPVGEVVTLADYRRRYAQYRSDPDSLAMHGAHPLIAVWDDHELANDSWRGGSMNHNDDEGKWSRRLDVAVQAYFEWMPIRGKPKGRSTRIFREYRFGDLMSLIMLDTRMFGRDRQPDGGEEVTVESITAALENPKRRMLGYAQEKWLRRRLGKSAETTWQVIGQQVLVSPINSPDLEPLVDPNGPSTISRDTLEYNIAMSKGNPKLLLDTWDGYPHAKQDLLNDLNALATNPVILSGDLHTSLAGDLIPDGHQDPVAVEFMTPSVTSPGFAEYLPEKHPGALRNATMTLNPGLKYMEMDRRGWLCMTLTKTRCTGEWYLLDGVRSASYASTVDRRLSVSAGEISQGLRSG